MSTTMVARTRWERPACDPEMLAPALGCAKDAVERMVDLMGFSSELSGTQKVALAIGASLHRQAGLDQAIAASIALASRRLCESVLSTLDLNPPDIGARTKTERDPFMFFVPYATESLPVPAIDEFLDIMDGKLILWRKPQRDPYRLACELQRLSDAAARSDTPALHEEYLEFLAGLRQPVRYVWEWIGTVKDGSFKPSPDRPAEMMTAMRQSPGVEPPPSTTAYGLCVSVNVSLAARCFKRRMLGLEVTNPLAGR